MKRTMCLLGALAFSALYSSAANAQIQVPRKPAMEVVFVLDTTSSMTGLINGAKQKIWSIVNEIVTAKPQPQIKIGFVGYRDKGDAYVTQVHDLTSDLDAAFKTLQAFQAQGGGDTPEHVNAGLHDAVTKLKWSPGGSQNAQLYQVIFLVGDCPPHMDYDDGLDYKNDCKTASEAGIFINTIRCGNNAETEKVWLDISKRGMGAYFSLIQDGGTVDIPTPFDAEMIKLGAALELTTVARRGGEKERLESLDRAGMGGFGGSFGAAGPLDKRVTALEAAPATAAVTVNGASNYLGRQAFNAKSGQIYAKFDLITDLANGRKLTDIKEEELPEELKKMTPAEREKFFTMRLEDRRKIQSQIADLEKKRNDYLKTELAKTGGKDGFDQKMLGAFKSQAGFAGFAYK